MSSCLLLHLFCLPPAGGRIRSQGNLMLRLRRRTSDGMEINMRVYEVFWSETIGESIGEAIDEAIYEAREEKDPHSICMFMK